MKTINILVPDLPDSISDATVTKWHKKIDEIIKQDENIVDIETDKVMLEISSPCDGILKLILEEEGKIVKSQQVIGEITPFDKITDEDSNLIIKKEKTNVLNNKENTIVKKKSDFLLEENKKHLTPSMRRLIKINNDENDSENKEKKIQIKINSEENLKKVARELNKNILDEKSVIENVNNKKEDNKFENRVKMTRLRQRIAERLLDSKNKTAMLTTFNEVNMQSIILLRKKYGEDFEKKHGIRIGFMSFFVKAVVQALKNFPQINAAIDKTDIVFYKNFDISIAISTPRGLITPVLRNTDNMSMSEIEKKIKEFSIKGLENKIDIKELIGGNFTITNGGIFGSLMSTPIINPPQTAILGMHVIQERPVVVNGKIKILPMMYLALSYDHRLIDGKESVSFLVNIKNILEDFTRILINV